MKIAIVGGGAAGFFAAIKAAEMHPGSSVTILEKSPKLLAKVKISGGGRCNVTNGADDINQLIKAYPRGEKLLRKLLHRWNTTDTIQWFEDRDVPLMTQEDNCVFPVSQDSQSVIDCFMNESRRLGVEIQTRRGVDSISIIDHGLEVGYIDQSLPPSIFDKVIVATGGSPKLKGLAWLAKMGHEITPPVPSLFTFNMPQESVTDLMGIVVEDTLVRIAGTKLKATGPTLITHWGMSGPAILKLSAFGARILSEKDYTCTAIVSWVGARKQEDVIENIREIIQSQSAKHVSNYRPYLLPDRLWQYLLTRCKISGSKKWGELGKKDINKLVNALTADHYQVRGKTTFKEEFVTCGGVSLKSINSKTLESKVIPGLYFAGEVMDIDGITGGYNFQAAWATGYVAGELR